MDDTAPAEASATAEDVPRGRAAADGFSAWVEPHLIAMHRLAARLAPDADPDDVVQEALGRAWRRHATYVPERGSPRTWLLAIVADQARKARVKSRRVQVASSVELPGQTATLADRTAEHDASLDDAIQRLASRQREVIDLFYFVDLRTRDIAELLGISEGTVKSTLSGARTRLRDLMLQKDGRDA